MKVKFSDLAEVKFLEQVANILNRGNEAKIKTERGGVVLIEEKRNLRYKVELNNK